MSARDRMLRDFEALTGEIATLERRLEEAKDRQDAMRRQLRAALRATAAEGPEEAPADGDPPAAVMEVVDAVRQHGTADAAQVADALGVSPSIARTRLQRAAGIGLLRRVKRGRYEAPAQAANE